MIKYKRIDNSLPEPKYETAGAVGLDLYSRIDIVVKPQMIELIPCNIIVETPEDCLMMVAARSSTPLKKGLMTANGVGIIDHDYCGPDDEIKYQAYNFTDEPVFISRGTRLAQLLFLKMDKPELQEVAEMPTKESRGGFGTTG